MKAARRAGVPYVVEPHGALDAYHWAENWARKRLYRSLFDRSNWAQAAGWIVSSRFEADHAANVLPDGQLFVVPLGVDDDLFALAKERKPSTPPTALYLGRLTQKKRLDVLLAAMALPEVRQTGLRLIVAGASDGTLKPDPHAFVSENDLEGSVSFFGAADRDARHRLLQAASIFVLPSEDESFGVAVAEAMAAGVAVVSSDHVGAAIQAGNTVVRVAIDPVAIASALSSLMKDSIATDQIATQGHQYASSTFTWSHSATAAIQAYEEVLEARLGN
jgi:glycosyltransferase involved in cell wall biosynthesis